MGTSTVHRSPGTPRWRIVNNLYENPEVPADRLLAEIFNAAEAYPSGLADAAVLERIETLLHTAQAGNWRGGTEAALTAARNAIRTAKAAAIGAGHASFIGDLADRAVHATLAGASRDPSSLTTPRAVLGTFLQNLIAIAIDHVVSRDLTAHLGKQKLPTASGALTLRRILVEQARTIATDLRVSAALDAAASLPRERWDDVVRRAWEVGATPAGQGAGQGGA
jgi:hypothetical protein